MKQIEISKLMNRYVDEKLEPREEVLVDPDRVKVLVHTRLHRGRLRKRRMLLAAAVLAACLGLVGWSYGERIFQLAGGGQVTIGGSSREGYGEATGSDGYDENGQPLVFSLEEGRLWLVARGQRVDVTDRVDEKTPYVDTWWDEEGNLFYVIVGGTPEDYGWYQGVTAPDGSGGGNGVLSSRTGVSPEEQTDPEWFTLGEKQVRELWFTQRESHR